MPLILSRKHFQKVVGDSIRRRSDVPSELQFMSLRSINCLLIEEGEVTVKTKDGKSVSFGKGDFVTFPQGLACIWDIKKPVKKHYNFK